MIEFTEHKRYRVVYRSNERKNAVPYSFIGDCLGPKAHDPQEIQFSCRPASETMSINTRWYIFDSIEEVPKTKPNRSPHKVTRHTSASQ